jgi:predicted DNA repair protein MutK
VAAQPFTSKLTVLVGISIIMTVGVYGLVAGIVKLDDAGLWLSQRAGAAQRALGRGLLAFAPWLMKALSVAGTAAMFLVGGSILVHGVPALGHSVEAWAGGIGGIGGSLLTMLVDGVVGVLAGAVVLGVVEVAKKVLKK